MAHTCFDMVLSSIVLGIIYPSMIHCTVCLDIGFIDIGCDRYVIT